MAAVASDTVGHQREDVQHLENVVFRDRADGVWPVAMVKRSGGGVGLR